MTQKNLFKEFDSSTAEEWTEIIKKELKNTPYNSLITRKAGDITIEPFYHGNQKSSTQNIYNTAADSANGLAIRQWINYASIEIETDKEANEKALHLLNTGADGIIFICKEIPDFNILLKDIAPIYCGISFENKFDGHDILPAYFRYLKKQQIDLSKIEGCYFHDVLEKRDSGLVNLDKSHFKALAQQIKEYKEGDRFKIFNVSASLFHNAGANIINELTFTLSKTAEYLDHLTENQVAIEDIVKNWCFTFTFGRDYFLEIAKIKAFKFLLIKMLKGYDYELDPADIFIHAETSSRTKSIFDFHVNLLRNTAEAMSAIISGCQSLYVAPHDEVKNAETKKTFQRTALNISNILKEEAHLDKTLDPTAGNYYINHLIEQIADKCWGAFLAFEKEGSYSHLFEKGIIKAMVGQDEKLGSDAALSRNDLYIGANTYQNIGEKLTVSIQNSENSVYLTPIRVTRKIEKLRGRTENHVNKFGAESRPTASIILFGTDVVAKAKADFTYAFLGMAGIGFSEAIYLEDASMLSIITKDISADLLIYCYKEIPEFNIDNLQHAHAKILIAGKEEVEMDLQQKGLYACIHRHTEAFSFLNQLLNDLKIDTK